jgi:hypothetical protein
MEFALSLGWLVLWMSTVLICIRKGRLIWALTLTAVCIGSPLAITFIAYFFLASDGADVGAALGAFICGVIRAGVSVIAAAIISLLLQNQSASVGEFPSG